MDSGPEGKLETCIEKYCQKVRFLKKLQNFTKKEYGNYLITNYLKVT